MEAIKLAVIEDAPSVRESLEHFFGKRKETELVLMTDSMETFLDQIRHCTPPDVILCDISLPGMNGIDGIRSIKAVLPGVDIIMLTVFNDSERIFKALCSGAVGYILKATKMSEVLRAVVEVHNGGSYMSPSIARKIVEYFSPAGKQKNESFSPRESQIIQGLTDGLSYIMIADRLSISVDTVRTHIKNIYRKLHVNSKGELISKVLKGDF